MFDSLLFFFLYFGPLCIYAVWKIPQMLRAGSIISGIIFGMTSTFVLTIVAMFSLFEIVHPLIYADLLGYWSAVWPAMFWIGLIILRYRKYYSFLRATMISFLATIAALGVWEIPIHVITIFLIPTAYQIALTLMLAFPYAIMIVPFRIESKWDWMEAKSYPRKWRPYLKDTIVYPIVAGIGLSTLIALGSASWLFNGNHYPQEWFQMFLRIGYAGVFLEYLWRTPKRKIISKTEEQVVAKL